MRDMLAEPMSRSTAPGAGAVRLSGMRPGDRGLIVDVLAESHPGDHGVGVDELQRRLLEFGFVEGALIEVLHGKSVV